MKFFNLNRVLLSAMVLFLLAGCNDDKQAEADSTQTTAVSDETKPANQSTDNTASTATQPTKTESAEATTTATAKEDTAQPASTDSQTESTPKITANAAPQATSTEAKTSSEPHPGKSIHDESCISCHDSGVYTREDRKVADFPALMAQVRQCDANLGTQLFDEDMEAVANYLNQAYYQYPQ